MHSEQEHRDAEGQRYSERADAWIDSGASIHVIVISGGHDPVEMTASEVRNFAARLLALADELD